MTIAFRSLHNPAVFPEHRFLPQEEAAESYYAAVEGGRMAMRESRTVICGLARNVAAHLPRTMARIERLGGLFGDYRVLIYENDSTDATPAMLNRWANRNDRVTVVSQRRGKQLYGSVRCPRRGDDMAEYRTAATRSSPTAGPISITPACSTWISSAASATTASLIALAVSPGTLSA